MTPAHAPAPATGAGDPVLLAERQGVVFVAHPGDAGRLSVTPRYRGPDVAVVTIPVSADEVRAAEVGPSTEAGAWPRAIPRPDLLGPALSRLVGGDHVEMSLHPGRDGLKATLVAAQLWPSRSIASTSPVSRQTAE